MYISQSQMDRYAPSAHTDIMLTSLNINPLYLLQLLSLEQNLKHSYSDKNILNPFLNIKTFSFKPFKTFALPACLILLFHCAYCRQQSAKGRNSLCTTIQSQYLGANCDTFNRIMES